MTLPDTREPPWLAELNRIDWSTIEHACGVATNVPLLLRTIALGDEDAALPASWELAHCLNDEGLIYAATPPALPFVVEALRTTCSRRVRAELLLLLAQIAQEGGDWRSADLSRPDRREAARRAEESLVTVWRGAALYIELLMNDPDADVRMHAAHTLGVLTAIGPESTPAGLPVRVADVVTALERRAAVESDALAASSVAFALGLAIAHAPEARNTLREIVAQPDSEEAVRIAAALALAPMDHERREGEAADTLVHALTRALETDQLFQRPAGEGDGAVRRSPWIWGRLRFQVCPTLCAWSEGDPRRMQRVLPGLLACVRLADEYTAAADIGPVLRWLWPGRDIRMKIESGGEWEREMPPPVTEEELIGLRRDVVEACYENARLWGSRIDNTDFAFMRVGLPTSRSEVGKLLGVDEPRES